MKSRRKSKAMLPEDATFIALILDYPSVLTNPKWESWLQRIIKEAGDPKLMENMIKAMRHVYTGDKPTDTVNREYIKEAKKLFEWQKSVKEQDWKARLREK